jgi:hypothetical protein
MRPVRSFLKRGKAMTLAITRRQFTAGGILTVLGGSALLGGPAGRAALAQASTDLGSYGYPKLDLSSTADSFENVPADTPAGRYLVSLAVDDGVEYASVNFVQPPAGTTVDDLLGMFAAAAGGGGATPTADGGSNEGGAPPTIFYRLTFAGGNGVPGGMTAQAVLDLGPGEWIVWAGDPFGAQVPTKINVTGDMPADLTDPDADVNVTFVDFGISVDGALTAGDHILRLENQGAQPHFLDLMKAPDGITNDELGEFIMADVQGPVASPVAGGYSESDFVPVASTAPQSIGIVQWVPATLEAGTYAAICWFPTAGTGEPHAMKGMHTVFTVTG